MFGWIVELLYLRLLASMTGIMKMAMNIQIEMSFIFLGNMRKQNLFTAIPQRECMTHKIPTVIEIPVYTLLVMITHDKNLPAWELVKLSMPVNILANTKVSQMNEQVIVTNHCFKIVHNTCFKI